MTYIQKLEMQVLRLYEKASPKLGDWFFAPALVRFYADDIYRDLEARKLGQGQALSDDIAVVVCGNIIEEIAEFLR